MITVVVVAGDNNRPEVQVSVDNVASVSAKSPKMIMYPYIQT